MKILIVRFSSIGDIVLTSPVLRGLKEQLTDVDIHYLTKTKFQSLLENNPRIDRLWTIEKSIEEILDQLKAENFDHVIDLHHNIRTLALKKKLAKPSASFQKLNVQKWLLVNLKMDKMPKLHIVDRYMKTIESLGVKKDGLPCEFYISIENEVNVQKELKLTSERYVGVAIGAQFATKCLPADKMVEILSHLDIPMVLLGGPEDEKKGDQIIQGLAGKEVVNTCGKFNLQQSASIVKNAKVLITHDTGLMHIASSFEVPVVSIWGNTVPELGMYPYFPSRPDLYSIHEVNDLSCRPCSKIGFQKCPKKHFNCMMQQDVGEVLKSIRRFF